MAVRVLSCNDGRLLRVLASFVVLQLVVACFTSNVVQQQVGFSSVDTYDVALLPYRLVPMLENECPKREHWIGNQEGTPLLEREKLAVRARAGAVSVWQRRQRKAWCAISVLLMVEGSLSSSFEQQTGSTCPQHVH